MCSHGIPDTLPEAFVSTITSTFGAQGRKWLERLPELLGEAAELWSLEIGPPVPNLSFHYVAPVVRADGTEAVLKAGVPRPDLALEISALRCFGGKGAVRLIDSDVERGLLLLERLRPGRALTELASDREDHRATSIAAGVMRRLWRPPPIDHPFPTIGEWTAGLARLRALYSGGAGALPEPLVARAEALVAELIATSAEPVLLHGDLHHDNILSCERGGWVAIDPKGVVGEPAYEVGAILRNLWEDRHALADPRATLERRVRTFADELGVDARRVRDWGAAQAVLSAWWTVEDGGDDWQPAVGVAEMLLGMRL